MYCESLTNYQRFNTRLVNVGLLEIGGKLPVRIQTMTNTDTRDIDKTVNQILTCFERGADLVRVTTPTIADVEALREIQLHLRQYLYDKPLIADIHFSTKVAMSAAEIVEKIRINPGNYTNTKGFSTKEFDEKAFAAEFEKIKEKCSPLIEKCKRYKTAIRVGTNHGSLSERIIAKYGNTVDGLVEATLEYLEICKALDFQDVVVSIKASNPTIMVEANRSLVNEMKKRGLEYPIHLGVTEAGNKIAGRVKSAVGIGALLLDGIGDTIRVSLTESPENELPVALKIARYTAERKNTEKLPEIDELFFNPYGFDRRKTYQVGGVGGHIPIVVADAYMCDYTLSDLNPDFIITTVGESADYLVQDIKPIVPYSEWSPKSSNYPLMNCAEYLRFSEDAVICFVEANYKDLTGDIFAKIADKKNVVFIAKAHSNNFIGEMRLFFYELYRAKCQAPVVIRKDYETTDETEFAIEAAIDTGVFFIDGLANGILLSNSNIPDHSFVVDLDFEILQATGRRLTKTEYISCPSCGRTLFDLEEVTERVQKATNHLKGLKIAIMGCIVNGPGEVADADYGYIGSGKNLVSLFKGKELVKKDIDENLAVDELIDLIKENGDWIDP